MKKISDAVWEILTDDEIAQEAFRRGILNLSAYAEEILPSVEEKTWKAVKKGSLVVALSRMHDPLLNRPTLKPAIKLDDLIIKSNLMDISYERTPTTIEASKILLENIPPRDKAFVMVTHSITEITIIAPVELQQKVKNYFKIAPKSVYQPLVAVTVRFSERYLDEPNIIYVILSRLALESINLREIVSTYTEISLIVEKKDLEKTITTLQPLLDSAT